MKALRPLPGLLCAALLALALAGCNKTRLGLEAAVEMQQAQAGQTVAPEQVNARNGDRIRLLITPKADGYGYVFHQGASGAYSALYPVNTQGSAPVGLQSGKTLRVPGRPDDWLRFDEQTGTERIIVVYASHKINRLETLLESPKLASGEIELALKELLKMAPGNAVTQKTIQPDRTSVAFKAREAGAFLMTDFEMRHH